MSAGEMSDGTPVSPRLDARMLADLREFRARHNTGLRHLTLTMRTPGVCSRCGGRLYYSVPSHAWVHSGAVPKGCVPRPTPKTRL